MQRKVLLAIAFSLVVVVAATAFTFAPMVVTISPSGPQSVMTFKVTNDSNQQAAVSISVTTREINERGVEKNNPTGNAFIVFPSRIVLDPNTSQNVKIQYKGNANITIEGSYRVIAEQLPVTFDNPTTSGINIMLRYIASLYVAPKNIKPKVVVERIVGIKKGDKPGLEVTLINEGSKHTLLFKPQIQIKQSLGFLPVEIKDEPMSEFEGQNLLALSKRIFFIPWEPAILGETYEGSFYAEYE